MSNTQWAYVLILMQVVIGGLLIRYGKFGQWSEPSDRSADAIEKP